MFITVYSAKASKALKILDKETARRIIQKIEELSLNPFLVKFKKIKGTSYYAIRVGKYRIIYSVLFDKKEIHILIIGPRETVYRKID